MDTDNSSTISKIYLKNQTLDWRQEMDFSYKKKKIQNWTFAFVHLISGISCRFEVNITNLRRFKIFHLNIEIYNKELYFYWISFHSAQPWVAENCSRQKQTLQCKTTSMSNDLFNVKWNPGVPLKLRIYINLFEVTLDISMSIISLILKQRNAMIF